MITSSSKKSTDFCPCIFSNDFGDFAGNYIPFFGLNFSITCKNGNKWIKITNAVPCPTYSKRFPKKKFKVLTEDNSVKMIQTNGFDTGDICVLMRLKNHNYKLWSYFI